MPRPSGCAPAPIPIGEPARSLAALPAHVAAGAGRAWLPAAALLTLASVIAGVLAPTRSELDTTADEIRIGSVLALALVGALTIFVRDVRTLVGATVVVNAGLVLFALVPAVLRAPEAGPRAVATWLPLFGVLATWAVAWLVALHATEPDLYPIDARLGAAAAAAGRGARGRRRVELRPAWHLDPGYASRAPRPRPWDGPAARRRRGPGVAARVRPRQAAPGRTPPLDRSPRSQIDARRKGLGGWIGRPTVAALLVLALALGPALLATGLGDLPAIAITYRPLP